MRSHMTAWFSVAALSALSGCYLGAETVSTTHSLDSGAVDLDAGYPTVDARTRTPDASPSDAGSAPVVVLDAGCSSSKVCPASAPLCSAGSCVACKQATDCTRFAATPACAPSGACVTCTSDQKSLCTGDAGVCDSTSNECVQCTADGECTSPEAAECKSDHTCGACSNDTQCAQFNKVCNAGSCVDCRPASEKVDCRSDKTCNPALAECPGTACDPKLLKCGSKTRSSVETCQACVSDSECMTANRCIDMTFGSGATAKDLGGRCLKTLDADAGCLPPHTFAIARTSLSGTAGSTYCGLNEAVTSCEALDALDKARTCSGNDATACAASGSICKTVLTTLNSCTYSCSSSRDCPMYAPCGGPSDNRYCGGTP